MFTSYFSGRYDLFMHSLNCLDCQATRKPYNLKSVIESGYWPSSVKTFSCLYRQDVFVMWDAFKSRMPGSSEHSFLKALEDISLQNARVGIILPFLFDNLEE